MAEANDMGYELDWDSEIEKDGLDFITLPGGDYNFKALSYERGRYSPKEGAKLPPCNMATVTLEFDGGALGVCTVKHKLFLHSSTEGLLCSFFSAIGQRQHGERVKMNWNAIPLSNGRAKLKVRKYTKDGEERTINEVDKFYDYDPAKMGAPVVGYAPQGPVGYPPQQSYAAPAYQQPTPQPNYAPPAPQQGYPTQPPYAPPVNYNPPAQQQAPAQPGFPAAGWPANAQPPAGMPPQTAVPGFEPGRF